MDSRLQEANYHLPQIGDQQAERCRNCQEKFKANRIGQSIGCRLHGVGFVRHSHRCDRWHAQGTLL